MVVESTVLACDRMIAERLSSAEEIITSAVMLASQLGIRAGPMRTRAMEVIASEVRLNRMIAVASEMSRNRACTNRNSTTAKAMMSCATVRTRWKSCVSVGMGRGLVTLAGARLSDDLAVLLQYREKPGKINLARAATARSRGFGRHG